MVPPARDRHPGSVQHTPLSKRSGPFAVLAAVGLAVGLVALHAVWLWFYFVPTDVARHRRSAGLGMAGFVALAGILAVLGLVAAVQWERHGERGHLIGAAGAGVVAMALIGVAEARTWSTLHNYRPEVRALSQVEAPPDWRPRFAKAEAAARPRAEQRWEATGGVDDVREAAIAAFTAWADPGSVKSTAYPRDVTVAEATRGPDRARLYVSPAYQKTGVVSVSLTVVRDDRLCCGRAGAI